MPLHALDFFVVGLQHLITCHIILFKVILKTLVMCLTVYMQEDNREIKNFIVMSQVYLVDNTNVHVAT